MPRFSGTLVDEDTKPRFGGTPVDAKPRFGGTPVEDTAQPQTLQSNVASRFDQFRQENPQVAGMQDSLVGNEPSFVQQQRQYPEGTISAPKPFDWLTRRASMATEYAKGTGDLAMEGRDYMAAEPFRRKVRSGEIDGGVVDFFQQGAWDTIQNNRAASASASRDELKMIQSEDREIRGALGDKMNLGDASFGGKVVKGGAQSAYPMLESMAAAGTASAIPGIGPTAGRATAGLYWQQQGAGQFKRAFLQDKNIDDLSDEELKQINEITQAMGVPYAAIEFAVSSIPGMKALGSSVDRQIANAVVNRLMNNPSLRRRIAQEGAAFGVRFIMESLVEESGQGMVDATTQQMLDRVETGDVGALLEYDWSKIFGEGLRQGIESMPAVLGITALGGAPGAVSNIARTEEAVIPPELDALVREGMRPENAQMTQVDGEIVPAQTEEATNAVQVEQATEVPARQEAQAGEEMGPEVLPQEAQEVTDTEPISAETPIAPQGAETDLPFGEYLHGTPRKFERFDGNARNRRGQRKRTEHVYFTTSEDVARSFSRTLGKEVNVDQWVKINIDEFSSFSELDEKEQSDVIKDIRNELQKAIDGGQIVETTEGAIVKDASKIDSEDITDGVITVFKNPPQVIRTKVYGELLDLTGDKKIPQDVIDAYAKEGIKLPLPSISYASHEYDPRIMQIADRLGYGRVVVPDTYESNFRSVIALPKNIEYGNNQYAELSAKTAAETPIAPQDGTGAATEQRPATEADQPISTGQPLEADTPPQSAAVLSPPTAPPSAEAVRAEPSTKEQSSLPAAEEATKGAPQAPSDESAASSSAATEEFPVEARPAGGEVAGKIETLAGEAYEQEASLPVDVPVDEMNRTELQHEARNLGISHRGSKDAIKRRILNARKSSRERARQFLQTVQEDQSIPKELVESLADVAPQTYQQTRTSEIFTHFREWLDKGASNVTQAEEFVNSKESPSAAKGAMFSALLDKYQHDGNYDAESALVEEYDTQLRESGRFVQAASLFSQMSGRGFMKHVQKFLDRHNVTVKEDVLDDIRRQYVDASRIENAQERSEAMGAVVEQVANMAPAGWKDWIHAYRYTNMLSNPRSHERNIFGNAATTYIARPASLVGQGRLIGAGRYLGTALKSLPDGARAFMEAWRSGSTSSRWYEALNSYGSQFESERMRQSARESKLRRSLLVIGRLLEAQDKFFSALIANGESARLIQEGVSEDIAVQRGNELAENLLYRERIGSDMSDRDAALGVRALDAAGHLIEQARNVPFVGRAAGWFIPFVRTPINIGKRMVEFSPLGYIRAPGSQKMSIETIGRANAGTAVVFMGAVMAALGRTTGEAPKDKEERRLWYDSGRRPWSVLIGDKWIPMWYLGPFAGALALPAAFRDSWVDNSELAGEGYIKKSTAAIAGLADFYASQTPLQGVKTFMDLMSGDSDYNSESALAFTAGQFVPASGFLRWANQLVFDPVYRRPGDFIDSLKKDYPWFSKQTLPYLDSEGNPVVRNRKSSLLPFDYGTVRGDMEQQRAQRNALVTIRRQNDKVIDGMVRGVLNDSISINALFDEMYNLADLTSDPRAEFTRLRGRARNKIAARGKDPDEYIPRKSSSGRATRPRRR